MNVEGAFRLTSRSGCEEAVDQGIGGRVVNAGLYYYRINVRGRVPASNAHDSVVFADADGGDIAGCYYEWRVEAFDRLSRTTDRKSVVAGNSVPLSVALGGRRTFNKKMRNITIY